MDGKIVDDLRKSYGVTFDEISVVTGGWLNRKWRISSNFGELLVKTFSYERYQQRSVELIDEALQRQAMIKRNGSKCPRILLPRVSGGIVRFLDDRTAYMVMEFCPGHIETQATVTQSQMRSLGDACGKIHAEFAKLPHESARGFPIDSVRLIDSLKDNFSNRMNRFSSAAEDESAPTNSTNAESKNRLAHSSNAAYKNAVISLAPILNQLTPAFLDALPKGIAHEDFSPDNMLFDFDEVTAILDFDRNCYSFLWHDIGRAVLSFALDLERGLIDFDKVRSFIDGYVLHLPLTITDIADALRITWCIETLWWIQPEFFEENKEKIVRFKDEIVWLTDNWARLDSIFNTYYA